MNDFIATLRRDPAATSKVAELFRVFLSKVPDSRSWTRTRFVTELAQAGLEIGRDTNKTAVVVGVSLAPPRAVKVVDGRIVRGAK